MYTVIIAEQKHIDKIREYRLLLDSYVDDTRVAFCPWISSDMPELESEKCAGGSASGETISLREAVPELEQIVSRRQDWRAVVLCDEEEVCLDKRNPFDFVEYHEPRWEEPSEDENDEAGGDLEAEPGNDLTDNGNRETMYQFYEDRLKEKKENYDEVSRQPLVRLATWLCQESEETLNPDAKRKDPDVPGEEVPAAEKMTQEHLEYSEYWECDRYKQELRGKMMGEDLPSFTLPAEVLCIAMRHYKGADEDWESYRSRWDEQNYSRFCEWNMYYDKMRYMLFDIADIRKTQEYERDYMRLLFSILLIAGNDLPEGCLRPNRVYVLDCDIDEERAARLEARYDQKLKATEEEIRMQIRMIRNRETERLSDSDAEQIFCANISVPVNMQGIHDRDDIFFRERFGLSFDCPRDNEETVWTEGYGKNRKAMKKLLKQPERAVKRATDDIRMMNVLENEKTMALNEFQLEDIRDHIDQEEQEMVDTYTNGLYEEERYLDRMEENQKKVRDVLERRMRRNPTIFCGVLCLALVTVGLIPLFIMNRADWAIRFPLPATLLLLLIALAAVAAAAFICLFAFRGKLMHRVSLYNKELKAITKEVEADARQYSVYLSHACNMMRGSSVISYHEEYYNADIRQIRILQKHIIDQEDCRAYMKEIFSKFLHREAEESVSAEERPYDYDFRRDVDYDYPMPATLETGSKAEFLEPGNYIEVPYGIVMDLSLRREELYD